MTAPAVPRRATVRKTPAGRWMLTIQGERGLYGHAEFGTQLEAVDAIPVLWAEMTADLPPMRGAAADAPVRERSAA